MNPIVTNQCTDNAHNESLIKLSICTLLKYNMVIINIITIQTTIDLFNRNIY